MTDSLKSIPVFRTAMDVLILVMEGYWSVGKFDIGPINSFYSFNEIEGSKLYFGGQTGSKFSKQFRLAGHLTYGTLDKQYKYAASAQYSINGNSLRKFPENYIKLSYEKETKFPGLELENINENSLFASFKRGVADKLIYYEMFNFKHFADWKNGFSTTLNLKHITENPGGTLQFNYPDYSTNHITLTEFIAKLRFAPNEKIYHRLNYRVAITTKYPVISLTYTQGFKDIWDGDYNYSKLSFSFFKRIYTSPLGFSDFEAEAGKVFTKGIPYPLLFIHRANQTYAYHTRSYNMMNFLEFISDQYVAFNIEHHFYGFFFNKIPLFKRLKWREIVTFKGIYGNITDANNPNITSGLMQLPTDKDGNTSSYSLKEKPYLEAGVGVGNIFKFFRVDYVQRLTYLDNPNVQKWGIRFKFKFDF